MSENTFILNIQLSADCLREVVVPRLPRLGTLVNRKITDTASLSAVLQEREWSAILCDTNDLNDDHTPCLFLDSLPGMACKITLDEQGTLYFPYVSEGCFDLLGFNAAELEHNPQRLLDLLHPDDREEFDQRMRLSATQSAQWNWEGRIVLPHNQEIKWLNLRAKHQKSTSHGTNWKGFMVNITQNKQAEIEVKHSRQRLRELSSHIESIKEEERTRIAREIHDEIGMLLTALKMDLAWLTQRLPADNAALQEKSQDMARLLDTAGQTANNLVHSLRPGFLDCFGIVAAIEIEAAEFTKRTGIPCKVSKSSDDFDVSDEQSITLFRVFQETLNNIMKHAEARQVVVKLSNNASCSGIITSKKCIKLVITDDGRGFDDAARLNPRSFGLRGIQERIGQLGGKVKITSKPGAGTQITVHMPKS
jgi:PAS domain S-box-containing protein